MEYILCEFNYGYSGQFYQKVENGIVINNLSLTGEVIPLPEGIPYGSEVIDTNPDLPYWAK